MRGSLHHTCLPQSCGALPEAVAKQSGPGRAAARTGSWFLCGLAALVLALPQRASAADAQRSAQAAPDVLAKASGKLPKEIVPAHYALTLTVDPARPDFAGSETIALTLRKPSQTITLNAKHLTIGTVRLDETTAPVRVRLDPASEQLHLVFARPIAAGNHHLQIDWRGKLGEKAMAARLAMTHPLAYNRIQMVAG